MRRADRLYRITDYLRGRRLTTARWLASRLDVSVRTIYRDIADLMDVVRATRRFPFLSFGSSRGACAYGSALSAPGRPDVAGIL